MTDYNPMTADELRSHKVNAHGRNFLLSDDGYDDMSLANKQGWRELSSWGRDGWDLGDWPYVVLYTRDTADGYELQSITEGDHTVYEFSSYDDRDRAINYMFLWYAAGQSWAPLAWDDREKLDRGELDVDEKFRGPYRAR